MKQNEKNMIFILLVILVTAIIIFTTRKNKKVEDDKNIIIKNNTTTEEFVQELEDGTRLNTSTKLNEAKEESGLRFENIQFTQQKGQSVLLADVTNNSEKATEFTLMDIILLDKNGNEIVTLGGIISPLQPGEKTQFNTSMTLDYTNVYDFKIVIK